MLLDKITFEINPRWLILWAIYAWVKREFLQIKVLRFRKEISIDKNEIMASTNVDFLLYVS